MNNALEWTSSQAAGGSYEQSLQTLLMRFRGNTSAVCAELKKLIAAKAPGSLAEWQTISLFFIKSGHSADLVRVLIGTLHDNPLFPWGHFAEALGKSVHPIPQDVAEALVTGAKANQCMEILSRSHALDDLDPAVKKARLDRRKQIDQRIEEMRKDLFGQLETLRSQELDEEEEKALIRLNRIFPRDNTVQELIKSFRAKKAVKFLEDKRQKQSLVEKDEPQSGLEAELRAQAEVHHQAMQEILMQQGFPESLTRDFAVQNLWQESSDWGLELLAELQKAPSKGPAFQSVTWLRCELLLRSRRFVDLLEELNQWESLAANDPDQVVGIIYLRALALHGLGQTVDALEMMEMIVTNHPNYRSASTLLSVWKGARR